MTLDSILPGPETSKAKPGVVFHGGPVERARARVLLRSSTVRRDAPRILPDVYFFDSREMLNKVLSDVAGPDRLRVYVGYTGWGAGQLDREIRLGAWHVFDGKSDIVFDPHPDTMWHRHIRRTELLSV
jgi:putative transcriptional regulator